MIPLLSIFTVALMTLIGAVGQSISPAEEQIAQAEAALGEAMIHRDVATLDRLVADNWSMQSETGAGTKAGFISDIKAGTLVVKSFRIHDMHVHVLGSLAWVQAYDDEQTSYAGKDTSGTYNWMDVWENRGSKWVSVATQLTRVQVKK
jgi:hypothetical protein